MTLAAGGFRNATRDVPLTVVAALIALPSVLWGSEPVQVRGGNPWGEEVVRVMAATWCQSRAVGQTETCVSSWSNIRNIERFCDGNCHVLYHQRAAKNQIKLVKESRR